MQSKPYLNSDPKHHALSNNIVAVEHQYNNITLKGDLIYSDKDYRVRLYEPLDGYSDGSHIMYLAPLKYVVELSNKPSNIREINLLERVPKMLIEIYENAKANQDSKVVIDALSPNYLSQAIDVAKKIFSYAEVNPEIELQASLYQPELERYNKQEGLTVLRYFTAVRNGCVVGIAGLYVKKDKTAWLGWFGVLPSSRSQGIGSMLLDHVIQKAKDMAKIHLYLYTSTDIHEADAQKLYEKYNFKITHKEQHDGYDILYRRKDFLEG